MVRCDGEKCDGEMKVSFVMVKRNSLSSYVMVRCDGEICDGEMCDGEMCDGEM